MFDKNTATADDDVDVVTGLVKGKGAPAGTPADRFLFFNKTDICFTLKNSRP